MLGCNMDLFSFFITRKFQEEYVDLREQLLNAELARGFSNWMTEAKKTIKKEDFRSEVY